MADLALAELDVDRETQIAIYTQIARIHAVDKAIRTGLSSGRFLMTYWPMTGQEAIPAALAPLLTAKDQIVTTYRGVHDHVAKGVPLRALFAEMLGRTNGLNKGKAGTPHICCPEAGSALSTAIVGAGPPIANGIALAARLRGRDHVTVVNFGDGATSIGAVHEAMNLAGIWRLPVIFLCQNNRIGEYTPVADYTASEDFASRATALGFRGVRLDSNDAIAFHRAMKAIVANVRAGHGPVFVEALTNRLGGHTGIADPNHLAGEALEQARAAWPVHTLRADFIAEGLATEEQLAAIDRATEEEVADAVDFAVASPVGTAQDGLSHVYDDDGVAPRRGLFPVRAAELATVAEPRTMSMAEAIRDAQDVAMGLDPAVFLLGEDIGDPIGGVFKTSLGLETKWGRERVRPTPIAEQAIVGAATGAAIAGMRPVAEIMFTDFLGVCIDQLTNHAGKQRYMTGGASTVPMTVRMICAGGAGTAGAQHSQSLEAWLLHSPGVKVVYPSTPREAKGLLLSCIFDPDPCVHIEPMALMHNPKQPVPQGDYRIPLGVAKVKRSGSDITLISYGMHVPRCLAVAELLAKEGISVEVLDLRTLMPLDYHRILDSVKKTRRALVVHLATEFCGLGSEIAATLNEELFCKLKAPVGRLGAQYAPIAFAKAVAATQIPHDAEIAARVRELVSY